MSIEIKKSLLGGYSVSYNCKHCKARLKSSLDKAAQKDNCPECHRDFIVPGGMERERINDALKAEHQRKAQEKAKKKADRQREKDRIAAELSLSRTEQEQKEEEARQLDQRWAESQAAMEAAHGKPPPRVKPGDIICPNPNCGYIGQPKKMARGNAGVGCLLCFLMLLPGLLYFVFTSGYDFICPRCGLHIRSGPR